MSDNLPPIDYKRLAEAQMDAAARARTEAARNAHFDQAAVYNLLWERQTMGVRMD